MRQTFAQSFLIATVAILSLFGIAKSAQAATVSLSNYGAVADGVTDNLAAINRAIAAAGAGGTVNIPAGKFAYRGVIRITSVKLIGAGSSSSILYALDYANESIFMYGNGPEVRNLQLTGVQSPSRMDPWETEHITVFGASNFVIDNVYIEGAAGAGILTNQGANHGQITNNKVRNTLADAIHMTDRSNFITVENNLVEYAGDDGVAVVSYQDNGSAVHDITARNNRILNNKYGRNMSVLGGYNILYENNYLDTNLSPYACVYIAQETPWHTFGVNNVTVQYNTVKNCGSTSTGHSAMYILNYDEFNIDGVKFIRNDIYQPSTRTAIKVSGQKMFNILLDNNRINGTANDYDISSPNVSIIRYGSGTVGYTAPTTSPSPTPTPTATSTPLVESAQGTTVPSASQIVDSLKRVFTLVNSGTVGNQIAINGVIDPVTSDVTLLLYYNHLVYQQNAVGDFYRLDSTGWTLVSDPRVSAPAPTESAQGTTVPSASQLVDSQGRIFTLVNSGATLGNQIAINGAIDSVTSNVTLLLYYNHLVYQQNSVGDFYRLDSTGWTKVSDPRAPAPASDTQAPSVAITSPGNGASFATRSTITVNANATDNVGIVDVKFYLNGTLMCTDSTAAYSCSMRLPKQRRSNTIEAVGRDAAGNVGRQSIVVYTK
jgi:hypothetical protein